MKADRDTRIALALCAAAFVLFALFGLLSQGTFNDDDIARYMNARSAFDHPEQFLSRWNRPGFVVLYALPAQLGYAAVELLTALLCSLTCLFTFRTARRLGEGNAHMAVIFVAFQPLTFLLSYSALTEPLAAFLLAAALDLLSSRRHLWSALVAAAIPLARLELSLVLIPLAVVLLRRGAWRSVLVLPAGVVLWNLAGLAAEGDPLYVLTQVAPEGERIYTGVGAFHYARTYIYIVGPVVFAFSVLGLVDAIRRRQLGLVWTGFLIMLAAYTVLSSLTSMGQAAGFLRHVVAVAPLSALLALRGFNVWVRGRPSLLTLGLLCALAIACWLFMSRRLDTGTYIGDEPEYSKLAVLLIITFVTLLRMLLRGALEKPRAKTALALFVVLLAVAFNFSEGKTSPLTDEQETVRDIAAWISESGMSDRVILCNHAWFHFFAGTDRLDRERYPLVTTANLGSVPVGAVVVWDGHYSHRLLGDVSVEQMEQDIRYRVLKPFTSPSGGFIAVVLEKTSLAGAAVLTSEEYRHAGLGIRWDLRGLDGWSFDPIRGSPNLLEARMGTRAAATMGVRRFFRILVPEDFVTLTAAAMAEQPGVRITGRSVSGRWQWVHGLDGDVPFKVGFTFEEGKRTAIAIATSFTVGAVSDPDREGQRLVAGLRFEGR